MCEQAQKNNSRSKSHSKWLTHRLDGVVALSPKIYSPAKISKGGTTDKGKASWKEICENPSRYSILHSCNGEVFFWLFLPFNSLIFRASISDVLNTKFCGHLGYFERCPPYISTLIWFGGNVGSSIVVLFRSRIPHALFRTVSYVPALFPPDNAKDVTWFSKTLLLNNPLFKR